MDVVGALEQDPDLGAPQRHREFLTTSVVFKEVRLSGITLCVLIACLFVCLC
jgi:hypothetical protein